MNTCSPPKVVLICGVAGVGKTSLIRDFIARHQWATTLSAGSIIAEARQTSDPEVLRTLPSDELERNQRLLIEGFARILPTIDASLLLLDAHTVVDGANGLYLVPVHVFVKLQLDGIIHVEAPTSEIYERRRLDTQRKRPNRTASELEEYQRSSMERAFQVGSELKVWVERVNSDQDALRKLLMLLEACKVTSG